MKKLFFLFSVIAAFSIGFVCAILKDSSPEWSTEAPQTMTRLQALDYCSDLEENNHSDWKLPKTSEIVTLNRSTGNYWASDSTTNLKKKNVDEEDKAYFYDFENNKKGKAFVSTNMRVICARKMPKEAETAVPEDEEPVGDIEDLKACKIARKEHTVDAWELYLKKFPGGVCTDEANAAFEKIACEKANNENTITGWKKYLKEFPTGECVNNANQKICDIAMKQKSIPVWKGYLEEFPEGFCVFEAEIEIKKLKDEYAAREQEACEETKRQNSIEGCINYLTNFPDGKCVSDIQSLRKRLEKEESKREAEARKQDLEDRTIGNIVWSHLSSSSMDWYDAEKYCEDLKEDGVANWRFPDIDDLRSLVKKQQTIFTGGDCGVRKGCLSSNCWSKSCAGSHSFNKEKGFWECSGDCKYYKDGRYSKLGDSVTLWSSSTVSYDQENAWYISFGSIGLFANTKSSYNFVRCIRYVN